jgi:hypothetical protein
MKQRQLRLGDVLDDYCPRERRLTNHVVVAMIGEAVKQTRCTTCEAEHEYKQARLPRQRRKSEPAALYSQVLASAAPKKVAHERPEPSRPEPSIAHTQVPASGTEDAPPEVPPAPALAAERDDRPAEEDREPGPEDGPVHRPLIRAQLPRQEQGQGPSRPVPDFTIRQPGGRPGRFRPRHQHPGAVRGSYPKGNPSGGSLRGAPRQFGGRPPATPHSAKRHGQGRKRSK